MKGFTLCLAGILLLAVPATAVLDPTPDLFGFYFDELADLNCQEGVVPFTLVTMYAIYTNPTVPEIVGFEFGMDVAGPVLAVQVTIPGYPFWDPIENVPYVVFLGEPLPLQPINILAVFNMLYSDIGFGPVHFLMRQADAPSGPGMLLGWFCRAVCSFRSMFSMARAISPRPSTRIALVLYRRPPGPAVKAFYR